jgi:preprotein translocase subunit SecD
MKPFTRRIVVAVLPVVLCALVVGVAWRHYVTGEPGLNFKLGVDLVGGTILVYEVDKDKFADARARQEFEQRSQQLAASLKRRIDPADLDNVTVRQAGPWRVEIILPTGGQHQADVDARAWQKLLDQVRANYGLSEATFDDVPQGQVNQLADRIDHLLEKDGRKQSLDSITQYLTQNYKERALTSEEVQKVKEKIAQVGSLEFRILANDHDDKRALELARHYFERARKNDGPERLTLTDDALSGRAPPPPRTTATRSSTRRPASASSPTAGWNWAGQSASPSAWITPPRASWWTTRSTPARRSSSR